MKLSEFDTFKLVLDYVNNVPTKIIAFDYGLHKRGAGAVANIVKKYTILRSVGYRPKWPRKNPKPGLLENYGQGYRSDLYHQ